MGAIRWEGPDQLEAVNKISFDEQTELFQLHLAPAYQDWLTWEHDGAFLLTIRHRQRDRLEYIKIKIERLYRNLLVNDRKMQLNRNIKRWALLICMGELLIINLFPHFVATYVHLLDWQFSMITIITTVYLSLAMSRVFLNAPPVSWNIPILGMNKYERKADDLMWNVFKLRLELENEFNP